MTKIVCTETNTKEFNALLKAKLPEFYDIVRALYAHGMINGLRGATITVLDGQSQGLTLTPVQNANTAAKSWLSKPITLFLS